MTRSPLRRIPPTSTDRPTPPAGPPGPGTGRAGSRPGAQVRGISAPGDRQRHVRPAGAAGRVRAAPAIACSAVWPDRLNKSSSVTTRSARPTFGSCGYSSSIRPTACSRRLRCGEPERAVVVPDHAHRRTAEYTSVDWRRRPRTAPSGRTRLSTPGPAPARSGPSCRYPTGRPVSAETPATGSVVPTCRRPRQWPPWTAADPSPRDHDVPDGCCGAWSRCPG